MDVFLADWLNLLIRWAHMVAGIGWIGTSFYFIALDVSLRRREGMKRGVAGTAWEVHGGGFYHIEKFTVAPDDLPGDLIWFKWEAYLTWLTGFALLVVQFYLSPEAWLIDPAVMALAPCQAVTLSVAATPAENMLLARYTPKRHRSLAFGLKFVLAFGSAPLALKLVAAIQQHTGEFTQLFGLLAALCVACCLAVVLLPGKRAAAPAGAL